LPAKLVVEVDGATHASDEEMAYDRRRREFMERYGWREMRFTNYDIYKNLSFVLEFIWREATARAAAPSTIASRWSPSPAEAGEDDRRSR
jgi:very-short-patch-repair endonuclease